MASSITLTGDKFEDRYFQLKCTQKSNGGAENSSTITWTLSAIGDDEWMSTGPTKVIINGTTVYSLERKGYGYGKFPVAQGSVSGTIVIPHEDDGSKKITVTFSTAVYYTAVKEYSDEWTLDKIERYADITSFEKSNVTETGVKISWVSDSKIDLIQYKKGSGSWTNIATPNASKGSFTISGLTPNTEQNIDVRFRRDDSQLYTNVSVGSFKTYDYPHCTNAPDFVIGNAVTLTFYNPLKREFDFSIEGNGVHIYNWTGNTGTTYKGINGEIAVTALYDSIPNQPSAKYIVETVYNGDIFRQTQGGTYSVDESKCKPTFTAFAYKDTNTAVTEVTKNNQVLVKGLSNLSVEITEPNKMEAKNSADEKYYSVSIDTLSAKKNYSETETVTIPVGVVSSVGTKRLNVRAYDSRGLNTLAPVKDITVYDYKKPTINASATRLNNFEAQTTLKVSGEYSRLTIGGADKNTIKSVQFRWREKGGTWSSYISLTATLSAGKFTCADVSLTFNNTKAFEIEVKVTDNFDSLTASTVPLTVDIGQAIFFISSNKKTCYVNGVEVATKDFVGDAITALFPAGSSVTNALYPVGSVVCMSTNKNPSSIYGGTWTLIDKGFKAYSVYTPSIFTAGTNVVADTVYLSRGANTIRIRLSMVVNSALSDTGMSLGTLNWSAVGVTGLHAGIIEQLAYRDGANGGIVYSIFHESGEIQQVDVFDSTPLASGSTFYLDFTFVSDYTRMLDSVCDKFYWKRTA